MKAFVIDVGICIGSYNCQIACKDEHVGNDWTPYAKPQPDTGQFWLKQNEFICPTEALKFGEDFELKDFIAKAEVLNPEYKSKPRVFYLNVPKKFMAGAVYDAVEKEVVIGAACTLKGNGKKWTETTDSFGDFWFRGLEEDCYDLTIEAKGLKAKKFNKVSTVKDVNLGGTLLEINVKNIM